MHNGYQDTLDRIAEPPRWFDEHAVPRFCEFTPQETANIYADECCLLLIGCQGCATEFPVCISRTAYQTLESARSLGSFVRSDDLFYGDPPNTGCCPAGPTMSSLPLRVLEFWKRDRRHQWLRVSELEVELATPQSYAL